VIDGQKVWTSNAHQSDWVFVIARTEPGSQRHHGLSFLLVPLDQEGVEVRPIEQLTGGSEFNEVFFTGARTEADLVVGEPGKGWGVAMGLLGLERGVSVLGQVVGFAREHESVVALAKQNGSWDDPAPDAAGRA
jgi:alkylation response protein AidB-like acyl-CoA dehydrogenase